MHSRMAGEPASIGPASSVRIKEHVLLPSVLACGAGLQGERPKRAHQECPTGTAACWQFDAW